MTEETRPQPFLLKPPRGGKGPRAVRRDAAADREAAAFSSADYWVHRYAEGGNSGKGSYGRSAVYKAHMVNMLAASRQAGTVLELGCGDGNQATLFDLPRYTGVDVALQMVELCRERFKDRKKWRFVEYADLDQVEHQDMTISLDVIFHLVEDGVFERYMRDLFRFAKRSVLIYSSDHDESGRAEHVRHRAYWRWVEAEAPEWRPVESYVHPFLPEQKFFRLFERRRGGI